jgi:hypothetical protein
MKSISASTSTELRRGFWRVAIPVCVLVGLAVLGCGGGPAVSVELMPNSAQTLEPGKTLPISATLSNDVKGKGVTWTLSGAGALVAETPTSVMYQAPTSIGAEANVTVTATPIAKGSRAISLTIVLVPQRAAESERKDHPDQKSEGAGR